MSQHNPGFLKLVNDAKKRIKQVSIREVAEKMNKGDQFYFVDTREESEWNKGRAKGAIHLGKGIIERDVETKVPDKDAEIILYCGGGYRSALAADALQTMGYRKVYSMDGGWRDWQAAGLPTET
jgi:rhodanese-related sulfurtransferase